MQILLIQDDLGVREKLVFLVESSLGARVLEASTLKEASTFIRESKQPGAVSIDGIIYDLKKLTPEEAQEVQLLLVEIPLIFCDRGSTPVTFSDKGAKVDLLPKSNIVSVLPIEGLAAGLIDVMKELIRKGILRGAKFDQKMCKIKTQLLLSVAPLAGDIFIRLSEKKFLKLFREGDIFDALDLERYALKKGVSHLFIKKEQVQEFAVKYRIEIEKLLRLDSLTPEKAIASAAAAVDTVRALCNTVGFTKEVQELVKAQVEVTMKSMGSHPQLSEVIKRMSSSPEGYVASHSNLLAYFACALATHLQLGSESNNTKLCLAAFLHDINLENDELAEIQSLAELRSKSGQFSPEEMDAFKGHPSIAADMARKMSDIPPDVDTIIVQHHELPDGSGFPRGLTHNYISPLSSVFIVAHDLAREHFLKGEAFDLEKYLERARKIFTTSHFKSVLEGVDVLMTVTALERDQVGS